MRCQSIKRLEEKRNKAESFSTGQPSRALQSPDPEQLAYEPHTDFRSPLNLNGVQLLNLTGAASPLSSLYIYRYIFVGHLFSETGEPFLNVSRLDCNLFQ